MITRISFVIRESFLGFVLVIMGSPRGDLGELPSADEGQQPIYLGVPGRTPCNSAAHDCEHTLHAIPTSNIEMVKELWVGWGVGGEDA